MKLFKGKKSDSPKTIQQFQQEFNETMFHLGTLVYKKTMWNKEVAKLNDEINSLVQRAENLAIEGNKTREKAKEELAQKVKEGQANLNETTPSNP